MNTMQKTTTEKTPGGIIRRAVAFVIDWYISGVLLGISPLLVNYIALGTPYDEYYRLVLSEDLGFGWAVILNVISLIILTFYFAFIPSIVIKGHTGQTLGMYLLKVRIVNKDYTDVSFLKLFFRNVILFAVLQQSFLAYTSHFQELLPQGFILEALPMISYGIGCISCVLCIFTRRHTTIQDLIAGTYVIQREDDAGSV